MNGGATKIEFFKSRGPGGQHKNKRRTAVRAVHVPTGMAAVSQKHRSQLQNKKAAFRVLQARLLEKERTEVARIATRKNRVAREKMMEYKRRRGIRKRLRLKSIDAEL